MYATSCFALLVVILSVTAKALPLSNTCPPVHAIPTRQRIGLVEGVMWAHSRENEEPLCNIDKTMPFVGGPSAIFNVQASPSGVTVHWRLMSRDLFLPFFDVGQSDDSGLYEPFFDTQRARYSCGAPTRSGLAGLDIVVASRPSIMSAETGQSEEVVSIIYGESQLLRPCVNRTSTACMSLMGDFGGQHLNGCGPLSVMERHGDRDETWAFTCSYSRAVPQLGSSDSVSSLGMWTYNTSSLEYELFPLNVSKTAVDQQCTSRQNGGVFDVGETYAFDSPSIGKVFLVSAGNWVYVYTWPARKLVYKRNLLQGVTLGDLTCMSLEFAYHEGSDRLWAWTTRYGYGSGRVLYTWDASGKNDTTTRIGLNIGAPASARLTPSLSMLANGDVITLQTHRAFNSIIRISAASGMIVDQTVVTIRSADDDDDDNDSDFDPVAVRVVRDNENATVLAALGNTRIGVFNLTQGSRLDDGSALIGWTALQASTASPNFGTHLACVSSRDDVDKIAIVWANEGNLTIIPVSLTTPELPTHPVGTGGKAKGKNKTKTALIVVGVVAALGVVGALAWRFTRSRGASSRAESPVPFVNME